MTNTIDQKIISIIEEMKNVTEIDPRVNLIDGGLLDSFDIINLIAALESTFQISIPGDLIVPENLEYVKDIAHLVSSQQTQR